MAGSVHPGIQGADLPGYKSVLSGASVPKISTQNDGNFEKSHEKLAKEIKKSLFQFPIRGTVNNELATNSDSDNMKVDSYFNEFPELTKKKVSGPPDAKSVPLPPTRFFVHDFPYFPDVPPPALKKSQAEPAPAAPGVSDKKNVSGKTAPKAKKPKRPKKVQEPQTPNFESFNRFNVLDPDYDDGKSQINSKEGKNDSSKCKKAKKEPNVKKNKPKKDPKLQKGGAKNNTKSDLFESAINLVLV